jgi:hypothetical protein
MIENHRPSGHLVHLTSVYVRKGESSRAEFRLVDQSWQSLSPQKDLIPFIEPWHDPACIILGWAAWVEALELCTEFISSCSYNRQVLEKYFRIIFRKIRLLWSEMKDYNVY